MKKFSKESMQNFMLLHAEKLILGGCIAATGLLIWSSLGSEESLTQTPSDLKTETESAQVYINQDKWDVLEPFREGEADAKEKIEKAKRIDPDIYKFALIGNVAPATAPRQDPEIYPPEQPRAQKITAGILMDLPDVTTPLVGFPEAPKRLGADGEGFQGLQGGGGRGGARAGGLDFGGGGGDFDRGGLPEDYIPLDRSGTFNKENALTMAGIWPQAFNISPDKITTNVLDVVCVTAVVDMQKQAAAYEKAFAQSMAFNDKRDRPVYQFLQVQRREVSDAETEWIDISENVTYNYPQQYPKTLVKMPFQTFRSAPEVISPDNWDPITSQPIPAFVMLDYQKFASHPALKQRREFPEWEKPDKKRMMGEDENAPGGIFGARDPKGAGDKDFDAALGDDDGDRLRKGSETETYKDAIVQRKPGGQYRLVRFFDLFLPTKASRSKTYEYRIRVWVGDPNQLDPTDGFHKNRGRRLAPDPTGEVKFAGDTSGDSGFGGSDMGDDNDMSKGGDGEGFDGMKKEVVKDINKSMLVPRARKRINAAISMQETQERFGEAAIKLHEISISGRDKPDPDEKLMDPLYVAEFAESGELEKIELPPSAANYAYTQYLRFARPSPWSETVRVTETKSPTDVYAGRAVRERSISMDAGAGEVEFEQAEPYVEVVVSSWIRSLGTKLPSKKKVYVGETLNFNKPAYVTHPVTWEILAAQRPRADEDDPNRFTLPFRTGSTIVDAFAGEERDLPNNKTLKMRTSTELLIMDANGNMKVSNQFGASRNYRNEIAEPDDSRFYGRARRQRPKRNEEDEDFGFDEP